MLRYILKRIVYLVFIFFIISIMLFVINELTPGDPARVVAEAYRSSSAERYRQAYLDARKKLGLDDPMFERYFKWMGNMLKGDFGYSLYYRKNVSDLIVEPMQNTVQLNVYSVVLTLLITIPLGILCAVKRGGAVDQVVRVVTIIGYSIPQFIIGLVFIFLFAVKLGWFPISGFGTPNFVGTGWARYWDRMYYLILPLITMLFSQMGGTTKFVRSAMIDVLSQDYIRTARAKGLKERVVIFSHAFRNALLPVITIIIGWFLALFSGSLIIENMFALNGMGKLFYTCLRNQDYQPTMVLQMFYVLIGLVGNLITDLSYMLVDPRVKLQ